MAVPLTLQVAQDCRVQQMPEGMGSQVSHRAGRLYLHGWLQHACGMQLVCDIQAQYVLQMRSFARCSLLVTPLHNVSVCRLPSFRVYATASRLAAAAAANPTCCWS